MNADSHRLFDEKEPFLNNIQEIRVNPWLKSHLQQPAAIPGMTLDGSFLVFDPPFYSLRRTDVNLQENLQNLPMQRIRTSDVEVYLNKS